MQEESRRLREASEVTQKQLEKSKQLVELSKKVTQAVESVRRKKTTVEPLWAMWIGVLELTVV
jgi:hypothetical protein